MYLLTWTYTSVHFLKWTYTSTYLLKQTSAALANSICSLYVDGVPVHVLHSLPSPDWCSCRCSWTVSPCMSDTPSRLLTGVVAVAGGRCLRSAGRDVSGLRDNEQRSVRAPGDQLQPGGRERRRLADGRQGPGLVRRKDGRSVRQR